MCRSKFKGNTAQSSQALLVRVAFSIINIHKQLAAIDYY